MLSGEQIIFWIAILMVAYTYVGYPLLLRAWAVFRPCGTTIDDAPPFEPRVTVVVVAYNEAARIRERIENLLAQDYPADRLNIVVASDGSDDDTVMVARKYQSSGVQVIAYKKRRGKSAVLNEMIPKCRSDIVVLADARQRFEPGAVRALASRFADTNVGAVSGELVLTGDNEANGVGEGVGFYWKYEKFIRRNESRVDSTIGVTGAIYALRRTLFEPIPTDTLLDDVLIPAAVMRRGYRVLFEPQARAYDRVAASAQTEFRRKVRTLAGNFQLFTQQPWLLNPFANRIWLQTVSHKFLRLLVPLWLIVAFNVNVLLLQEPLYRWLFVAQCALYAAAACGYELRDSRWRVRALKVPYVFCMLNWAVVVGFARFIFGRQRVAWETGQMADEQAGAEQSFNRV